MDTEKRIEFEGQALKNVGRNMLIVFGIILLFGCFLHYFTPLTFPQVIASTIFLAAVLETIVFWSFRMGIALICIASLLLTKTIDVVHLVEFASLEVILFLICMMTITAMARDVGFFHWLMAKMIKLSRFNVTILVWILCFLAMFLAMLIDEVTSIIFITAIVIEICTLFAMNPLPLLITCVLATNIGSSGTVLGNPIGILIAMKAGLSFEDFLHWAFPVSLLAFLVTMMLVFFWNRNYFKEFKLKVKSHFKDNLNNSELFNEWAGVKDRKEFKIGVAIFFITLIFIALHRRIEEAYSLPHNTMLLVPAFMGAGIVFLWKRLKAKVYMDKEVDWRTLVFFMLLFAKAGTLKYVGVTDILAHKLTDIAGLSLPFLITLILWISAFGSAVLDNVVLVAAFIPIVQTLAGLGINARPLWFALLFGGCFGGNITMIGSTANIVALGILEKRKGIVINFFQWFWIGLGAGIVSTLVAWGFLFIFYRFM